MSRTDDATGVILAALAEVAPDADLANLDPGADLREALELDSMDFLNVVVAVHDATGIDIPERDYVRLVSLGSFADYLASVGPIPRGSSA